MKLNNIFQVIITSPNNIQLNYFLFYFLFLLKQNNIFNLKILVAHLPTTIRKFTFLRSPHIYKTSRTQLELRTWKKYLIIKNCITKQQINTLKHLFIHILKTFPTSISLTIKSKKILFI